MKKVTIFATAYNTVVSLPGRPHVSWPEVLQPTCQCGKEKSLCGSLRNQAIAIERNISYRSGSRVVSSAIWQSLSYAYNLNFQFLMSKQSLCPKGSKKDYSKLLSVAICNSHKCSFVPFSARPLVKLTAKLLVARDRLFRRMMTMETLSMTDPFTGKKESRPILYEYETIEDSIRYNCNAMGIIYSELDFD